MYRIMFVCHGNICRSPMAEFLCKNVLQKEGRLQNFLISSSAVSKETIWNGQGEPIYPQAKKILENLGIDCSKKRSQELKKADGEKYDLFICMDEDNVRRAIDILGWEHSVKVKKLLTYVGEDRDVADPWYTRDFEQTYLDLMKGLKGLLKSLK